MNKLTRSALAAVVLCLAAGCSAVSHYTGAAPPPPSPSPSPSPPPLVIPRWINGVALPLFSDFKPWEQATGEHPAVAEIYSRFGSPFPLWEARQLLLARAIPLIQIDPQNISLAAIAHGTYDAQLRRYNLQIRSLNDPVFLSFGHEMNGNWYSWGCDRTSPQLFRAAWRHVHDLITASRVTWIWTVNVVAPGGCPLRPWYPGKAYVNWVGIDGYLRLGDKTFGDTFALVLSQLHRFVPHKPTLVTESGVPIGPGWAQAMNSLYRGAHRAHMRGVVYFDGQTSFGDYRPQDQPAALRVFKRDLGE